MRFGKLVIALSLISALAFSLLLGCTQRVLDFTIISSKNVQAKVDPTGKGKNRVRGTDYVWWILAIPLGAPNMKEAIDRAIESAGPDYDALIDGVVYASAYWYILTGRSGIKVEGTPINSAKLMAQLEQEGKDVNVAMRGVLYHTSRNISNEQALREIKVIQVADLKNQ